MHILCTTLLSSIFYIECTCTVIYHYFSVFLSLSLPPSLPLSLSRSEEQLMLTKVFFAQKRMLSSCSLNDFSESCPLPGDPGVIPKQSSQAQAQHNSSFHYSLRPPSSSPGEKNQHMFTYIRVLLQCTMGSWDCL